MKTIVCAVSADHIDKIAANDAAHPELGVWLDTGSYGRLIDPCDDRALGIGLDRAAAAAGHYLVRVDHIESCMPDDGLIVVRNTINLREYNPVDEWTAQVASGAAISLVVFEQHARPLWLIAADRLPCMGPVEPSGLDDLLSTLIKLSGGTPARGRFLLAEPAGANDEVAHALVDRLRQLYGE